MKNFTNLRKVLFLILPLIAAVTANAQITGTTPALVGSTQTYTYDQGAIVVGPSWVIGSIGTKLSSSASGTTYTVTVKWNSAGTANVQLKSSTDGVVANLPVTVCSSIVTPSVSMAVSPTSQCQGNPITFTATPTNATSPTYTLFIDGASVWSSSATNSYTTSTLSPGNHTAYFGMTVSGCVSSGYVTSSVQNFTVNAPTTPTVGYTITQAAPYCTGAYSFLNLTATGATGSTYQWLVNGTPLASSSYQAVMTNPYTTTAGTYSIQLNVSGISGCYTTTTASGSGSLTMNQSSVAGTLAANQGAVCGSGSVALSVSGNTGAVTGYMMQVNGGSWTATSSPVSVSTSAGSNSTYNFYAIVQNGVCPSVNTPTTTTNVYYTPSIGTPSTSPSTTQCGNSASTTVSVSSMTAASASWQYQYSDDGGSSYNAMSQFVSSTGLSQPFTMNANANALRMYRFQVVATNGTCSTTSGVSVASISPYPQVTANSQTIFSGTPSSINISSPNLPSATSFSWVVGSNTNVSNASGGSGSTIAQPLTPADGINPGTVSYTITPVSSGCTGTPTTGTVSVYPIPAALVNGAISSPSITYYNNFGYGLTLSTRAIYYSYQWYNNGNAVSGATSATYTPTLPGAYTVRVSATSSGPVSTSSVINIAMPGVQGDSVNTVSRTVFYKAGLSSSTSPYTLQPNDLVQKVTFSDGLGRTVQTLGVGQSPANGDIVFPSAPGRSGLTDSTFLPYATTSVQGTFRHNAVRGSAANTSYNSSEQYLFYQGTSKVASDVNPFARAIFRNTPDARVTEQGAPGAAWQPGTNHTVRNTQALSTSTSYPVLQWNSDGTTTGYYPDNTVWVTSVTDENNHVVNVYKNKLGQTVLKQVQADGSTWLLTYYIYDVYGQLIYQIPPKAMSVLGGGTTLNANSASVSELIYTYVYDARGRLIQKKVPGSAVAYMVYDQLDRVVLTQDANQRAQGVWMFVKYDYKNRPAYSGQMASASDRATLQSQFDALNYSSAPYFETRAVNATYQGYTNNVLPTTGLTVLAAYYYDNYDFDGNGTADYSYDNTHLSGMPSSASAAIRGLATGNKKLILGTSNWLTSVVFYDNLDRPIQTLSNNHVNLNMNDKVSVLYFANNLSSKVQKIKTTHSAAATVNVTQRYTYDNSWRSVGVYQMIDNGPNEQLVALYKYNALGQPVEKNLHLLYDAQDGQTGTLTADNLVETQYKGETNLIARNSIILSPNYLVTATGTPYRAAITSVTQAQAETNGRYLQSVDMRYNIRGWLTSINNAQLTNDGTMNDDANDYFGMELSYNTDAGIGNALSYNGNISAIKWKGPGASLITGTTDQRSFKYSYDYSDRLTGTTFAANTGSAWTKEANTLDETMSYDVNGNILNLTRKQNQRGLSGTTVTSTPLTIDNLTYSYTTGNQLSNVSDAVSGASGFSDGSTSGTSGTEYTYDAKGSMLTDVNKGITSITYNVLGKAQQVTYSNGTTIVYTYDAAGTKLKTVTTVGGTATTADYVKSFVYSNNALSFFSSPEGRVVKSGSNYEYQYSIADHQGNTRVVFTSADPIAQTVTAGFETANQATEAGNFSNYQTGAHINQVATNANTGTNSLWLNGGYAGQVGLAKSYKVFPGDQLSIQAYAKYNSSSGTGNLNAFAAALLTAFNLATPAPGETGTASSAVNTWGGIEAGGYADGTTDQGDPKVFVNIVLFDRNYRFLDVTFAQLTTSGALMSASYSVKEAGYAYLYLSNENPTLVDVYFDDVKMSYTPGNIVQSNEYYAHGLPTANSWTRDNAVANNFLANGGTELNSTSQLYDLDYRNYDPVLGRLNQVDPMADKYSSVSAYHFGFNNPVSYTDINGADPNGNGFVHPPDEPYDWFGFNSNMGRDQAYNHGGASGGQIRYDGSGGYFQDTNGNGVQDSGEEMGTGWFKQTTTYQITHTFDGEVIASYKQYETEYFYVDPLTQDDPAKFSIAKAVAFVNANSVAWYTSLPKDAKGNYIWRCATAISNALNAGFDDGIDHTLSTRSIYAKNDGPMLTAIGFNALTDVNSENVDTYTFKAGDVAIIQPPNGTGPGHIEMYNGTIWVSDWKQTSSIWPGQASTWSSSSFTVYRYPDGN